MHLERPELLAWGADRLAGAFVQVVPVAHHGRVGGAVHLHRALGQIDGAVDAVHLAGRTELGGAHAESEAEDRHLAERAVLGRDVLLVLPIDSRRHELVQVGTLAPHLKGLGLAGEPGDDAGLDRVVVRVDHLVAGSMDKMADDARNELYRLTVDDGQLVGRGTLLDGLVDLRGHALHPARRLLEVLRLDQPAGPPASAGAVVLMPTTHPAVLAGAGQHGVDLLGSGERQLLVQAQNRRRGVLRRQLAQCFRHGLGLHVE